ncbi:hypothetical protein BDV97DRAFT_173536 [Delphinella strobiligena]|nr:hypothetical protein BDV97DRAFT_173536 [Delphinella strobiligena]
MSQNERPEDGGQKDQNEGSASEATQSANAVGAGRTLTILSQEDTPPTALWCRDGSGTTSTAGTHDTRTLLQRLSAYSGPPSEQDSETVWEEVMSANAANKGRTLEVPIKSNTPSSPFSSEKRSKTMLTAGTNDALLRKLSAYGNPQSEQDSEIVWEQALSANAVDKERVSEVLCKSNTRPPA